MNVSPIVWKIFGAAFDPLDHPDKVELQRAYLSAVRQKVLAPGYPLDPYDLILSHLSGETPDSHVQPIGRFTVASWLRPRPLPTDLELLLPERFTRFLDSNGCEKVAEELKDFVVSSVFPDHPFMVGVDHSLTGGVIGAIAEHVGPEHYSLLVLDSHFDAIPLAIRRNADERSLACNGTASSLVPNAANKASVVETADEFYSCGNFIDHLLERNVLLPQHTIMIGVTDHPFDQDESQLNAAQRMYKESYDHLKSLGITFIPGGDRESSLIERLEDALARVRTPWVYVSVDADVGVRNSLYAVRFLERKGLSSVTMEHIFDRIADRIRKGTFSLIGFDIMEVNIHLAGLPLPDGTEDQTCEFLVHLAKKLLF